MFWPRSLFLLILLAPVACFAAGGTDGGGKVIQLLRKVVGGLGEGKPAQDASAECLLISMATPESKAALTIGRGLRDAVLAEMRTLGIERIFTEEQITFAADQKLNSGLSTAERAAVLSAKEHLLLVLQRDPDALGSFLGKLLREHVSVLDAVNIRGIDDYIATLEKYPEPDQRLILIEGRRKIIEFIISNGNIELNQKNLTLFSGGILAAETVYSGWNGRRLFDQDQLSEMNDEALKFESAQVEVISWLIHILTEAFPAQPRELIDTYWKAHLAEKILFQLELDRRALR